MTVTWKTGAETILPVARANEESRYVVHEHHAHTHHFEFRLERAGVLKGWSLAKDFPDQPGERRLAIALEDRPLCWASYEGIVPPGQGSAGTVSIWDRGRCRVHQWSPRKISFSLSGELLGGPFVLVPYASSGPTHWLLIRTRADDEPRFAECLGAQNQ